MDRIERLEMIERLKAEADEGRQRIAEREQARESDVLAFDDWVRSEPQASPPVQKSDGAPDLLYRTNENALVTAGHNGGTPFTATGDEDWSGWENWLQTRMVAERREVLNQVAKIVGEFASEYVHGKLVPLKREIADLRTENAEVKRMLGEALTQFPKVEAEAKSFAEMLDLECKNHDHTVHKFELALAEMRGRMSAILRDYVT
jgi:hypothetical protein